MRPNELAAFIDHAALKPTTRQQDVDTACAEALQFAFRGLVVPTNSINRARRQLRDSGVQVIGAVGFPHGTSCAEVKVSEARRALELGADEVDYVISVGAVLDGDLRFVRDEATAIVRACSGRIVKAILEVGYLDPAQVRAASDTLADTGVAYVKTCTGFAPGGATPSVVKLMSETVAGRCLVKASGGIQHFDQAVDLLRAGAAVLGTSRGRHLCGG
jgi:deoxyribose-phosphate aldolase